MKTLGRRTGAIFCIELCGKKITPSMLESSTRFGKMDGAPSGARTLGTLIKSQVTFFRALMKQRNAAHFCFCGFYGDVAVNLQGQF